LLSYLRTFTYRFKSSLLVAIFLIKVLVHNVMFVVNFILSVKDLA
jgi:hypothetical protein